MKIFGEAYHPWICLHKYFHNFSYFIKLNTRTGSEQLGKLPQHYFRRHDVKVHKTCTSQASSLHGGLCNVDSDATPSTYLPPFLHFGHIAHMIVRALSLCLPLGMPRILILRWRMTAMETLTWTLPTIC